MPSSQDDHPWIPKARTTTETVQREAMQALVRVQAQGLWWRSALQTSLSSWSPGVGAVGYCDVFYAGNAH